MKIQEYFKNSELECKCRCGLLPDTKSIESLYAVRLILDIPMIITSGARCEEYNQAVGGSKESYHLIGAFDIKVPLEHEYHLIEVAQFVGFTGIGIKNNSFIHIDAHHLDPVVWTYNV